MSPNPISPSPTNTAPPVPLHPEAVEGSDRELRWVLPSGTLGFVGQVRHVPAAVQTLLDEGIIETLTVEPTAIRTRLGLGRSWRGDGDRVRTALQSAVATPARWTPAEAVSIDAVLRMAVQQVIEGEVGGYIRSHGGALTLLSIRDGAVEVRLDGACAHCPAAEITLTTRFEKAVRARCPDVRSITARTGKPVSNGRRWPSLNPRSRRS
ncbi:MAG: NifU family protein [Microlunatus sp.]|nr:NifU family protein [Microlunatus sp.]MDN5770550.1 NifU family protein [Microlunatus sp.]